MIEESEGDCDEIATAYFYIALSNFINGDYENAINSFRLSNVYFRRVVNPNSVARNTLWLGAASHLTGDVERASKYLEEAQVDYQDLANSRQVTFCLFWKGLIALSQGRYGQAAEVNDEATYFAHKSGNRTALSLVLCLRTMIARQRGDISMAWCYAREGLQVGRDRGGPTMHALLGLGRLALQAGDWTEADRLLRRGLEVLIEQRVLSWTGFPLDGLAILALQEGKLERAARLFGTRQWRGVAHTFSPIERASRETDFIQIEIHPGRGAL